MDNTFQSFKKEFIEFIEQLQRIDLYILKDKKPVLERDVMKWREFIKTKRGIKKDYLKIDGKEFVVSTVFLGLDRKDSDEIFGKCDTIDNSCAGDDLVLFETMIFIKGCSRDLYVKRYCTWEEAIKGHQATLDKFDDEEYEEQVF